MVEWYISTTFGASGLLGEVILRDKTNNQRESAGESQRERDHQIQKDLEPASWHAAGVLEVGDDTRPKGQRTVRSQYGTTLLPARRSRP